MAEPVVASPAPSPTDWRGFIPDDVKADTTLAPILEKISEKDVPALVKSHVHLVHKMGSAINLPGKDAKPEEMAALQTRLREAGVMPAFPATPQEYGIVKPDQLPEGIGWNDQLATGLAGILHKYQVPKEAAAELLQLHQDSIVGAHKTLQTSFDAGVAALKKEFGAEYDSRKEAAGRMIRGMFKTPEEEAFINDLGLGDHPGFLGVIMRLAPLALQDSSFMANIAHPGGELTGDEVRKEMSDIMSNPENPKHKLYWQKDKATLEYVDNLYKRAYGNKPVEVGSGLGLSAG